MKNETNIANVCKECDYSPAFLTKAEAEQKLKEVEV